MDDATDPLGRNWQGIEWSAWATLDAAIKPYRALAPQQPGVYRIRCPGLTGLIYVGESGYGLRERFRRLARAIAQAPGKTKGTRPHYAGYCGSTSRLGIL